MTPAARLQAAIELLDAIIVSARDGGAAADTLIARYFAERRYAGSKDRRAVRALVYDAIRLLGARPVSGRAAMLALAAERPELADLFGTGGHGPAAIEPGEAVAGAGLAPRWLVQAMAASGIDKGQLAALLERAPLDIRVNSLKADATVIGQALPQARSISGLPNAFRLPGDVALDQHPLLREGAVEVQDAGSQWVTAAARAASGDTVIDLCSGAGGKTLALAADMANHGRIVAADIDRARLSRLGPRAARAGISIVETRLMNPNREEEALADLARAADLVLIDAPCSGTGTWRRNPEARWRLTPERLERLAATQMRLLDIGAPLVKPGGALAYIVCSLLDAEGRDQIAAFLARRPDWACEDIAETIGAAHGPGRRLTPARHSTDGFFVAMMRAPC